MEQFDDLATYGANAERLRKIIAEQPDSAKKLHENLSPRAAEIVWAARFEMARMVEDVLARRLRVLFLDARAAIKIAPQTARIMARELGKDEKLIDGRIKDFNEIANGYLLP